MRFLALLVFLHIPVWAASETFDYDVKLISSDLDKPVGFAADPRYPDRVYVLEQPGRVRVILDGILQPNPILDIRKEVTELAMHYDERGLLGIALHPQFSKNHRLFLNYTTRPPVKNHISEFLMKPDGTIDPASERVVLEIEQPNYPNHKGGNVAFGPDGYLYIGTGDGGSAGDPHGNGQNLKTLLGKMLRIDIDGKKPYAIPKDNPFKKQHEAKPEIFAYGLRNPWRYSFDKATGLLWVGDVGQDTLEEIDIVEKGKNYGWNIMEGKACFKPSENCPKQGLELPILDYTHEEGTSIIGGYVYRGKNLTELIGSYIYGDWGSGNIWSLKVKDKTVVDQKRILQVARPITSFGQANDGELYILSRTGEVYRLEKALKKDRSDS